MLLSELHDEIDAFTCETSKEFDRQNLEIARLRADNGEIEGALHYTHVAMRRKNTRRGGSAAFGAVCVEISRILRISEFDSTRDASLLAELCVVV